MRTLQARTSGTAAALPEAEVLTFDKRVVDSATQQGGAKWAVERRMAAGCLLGVLVVHPALHRCQKAVIYAFCGLTLPHPSPEEPACAFVCACLLPRHLHSHHGCCCRRAMAHCHMRCLKHSLWPRQGSCILQADAQSGTQMFSSCRPLTHVQEQKINRLAGAVFCGCHCGNLASSSAVRLAARCGADQLCVIWYDRCTRMN